MTDSLQANEISQLITDHQRSLYIYILSLIPISSDAEEVLQNTNLVLWRKADTFTPNTNFSAWAMRVAHLEVLNFRSKQSRETIRFETDVVEAVAADSADYAEQVDLRRRALKECLQKLRTRDRDLVHMRYDHGKSVKEMANVSGRSMDAMYQALHRVRRSLMACINRFRVGEESKS